MLLIITDLPMLCQVESSKWATLFLSNFIIQYIRYLNTDQIIYNEVTKVRAQFTDTKIYYIKNIVNEPT